MCGRFVLLSTGERIASHFLLDDTPQITPRYNITPSQDVLAICALPDGYREPVSLHWGLVPHWSKGPDSRYSMINARAETAAQKPAYREPLQRRRCLVPADGYYEWQTTETGKQPHYIHPADGELMALAGLWEQWEGDEGEHIASCTLLTRPAQRAIAHIHERMPIWVPRGEYDAWLNPQNLEGAKLLAKIAAAPPPKWAHHAVSKRLNNPNYDQADLIKPLRV